MRNGSYWKMADQVPFGKANPLSFSIRFPSFRIRTRVRKSRRNFRVSRGFPAAFRALSGGLSTHFHGFQATFHGGQLSTVFRRFSTHFHGFPAAFHGLSAAFRRSPDSGYRPRRMTGMACHAIVGLCQ